MNTARTKRVRETIRKGSREEKNERRRQAKLVLRSRLRSSCAGCSKCSAIKARETWMVLRDPRVPVQEQKQGANCAKVYARARDGSFTGKVCMKKQAALSVAQQEEERMVFWSDGSKWLGGGCGIGVAYCDAAGSVSWGLREYTDTSDLEVYAIAKAPEIAWETCRKMGAEQRPSKVFVYSDCLGALDYFSRFRWTMDPRRKLPLEDCLVRPGIVAAEELSAIEIAVELRWVPGHADILGIEKADLAAWRLAAKALADKSAQEMMTEYPLLHCAR